MSKMTRIFAAGTVAAAMAAAPAAAQYGYSYGAPYGNAYGYYNNSNVSADAAQRCSAAVQQRLSTRSGLAGILGAVLGARATGGRVLQVTQVNPRRNMVRVRGLANSGANYGPYGYGAYGATGYGYQPDLSFKCDVDYRGYVRDIDINRRR
ncbi:hypothetical protein G7076_01470 [Sphingomonas sp. HDW15A]|uniref:hypothetical protein n=1 Tax=Sphingomonas sp. HDW15A TaxID=2714942 RepID=UPI00140C7BB1|nr:hypothetical protein [Sphingomonas sp. HDW15A]QIK95330.1 hypothetical protein G7076_01470 [Sphingomonas sp. HDW15A]